MAQAAKDKDKLLRTGEAARHLGISEGMVRYLANNGRLAFEQTPYGKAFRMSVVERLKQERKAA